MNQQSEKEELNHVHVHAREVYEKPAIEIIEMETEGILCTSATGTIGGWGEGDGGEFGAG